MFIKVESINSIRREGLEFCYKVEQRKQIVAERTGWSQERECALFCCLFSLVAKYHYCVMLRMS